MRESCIQKLNQQGPGSKAQSIETLNSIAELHDFINSTDQVSGFRSQRFWLPEFKFKCLNKFLNWNAPKSIRFVVFMVSKAQIKYCVVSKAKRNEIVFNRLGRGDMSGLVFEKSIWRGLRQACSDFANYSPQVRLRYHVAMSPDIETMRGGLRVFARLCVDLTLTAWGHYLCVRLFLYDSQVSLYCLHFFTIHMFHSPFKLLVHFACHECSPFVATTMSCVDGRQQVRGSWVPILGTQTRASRRASGTVDTLPESSLFKCLRCSYVDNASTDGFWGV